MGGTLYDRSEWVGLCTTGANGRDSEMTSGNGRDSVQQVGMGGTLYDRWEWVGLCMTGGNGRDSV